MHIDLLKDWPYTFQGQIVYGVVGSFNAPFYFGVDNSSGEVAIINDLKTDIRQQYDVSSTFLFRLSGHVLYMYMYYYRIHRWINGYTYTYL